MRPEILVLGALGLASSACEKLAGIDDRTVGEGGGAQTAASSSGAGGPGGGPGGGGGLVCAVPCGPFACVDGTCDVPIPSEGLLMRIRSDVGVELDADGGVSSWQSMVGQIAATQGFGDARPEHAASGDADERVAVRFDGNEDFMELSAGFQDFSQGLSAFAVARVVNAADDYARIFDLSTGQIGKNALVFGRWANTNDLRYESHDPREDMLAAYIGDGAILAGTVQLFEVIAQPSGEATLFRDGVELQLAESQVNGPITIVERTSNFLGRSNFSSDALWGGDMMEVVLYARELSEDERLDIEQKLMAFHAIGR